MSPSEITPECRVIRITEGRFNLEVGDLAIEIQSDFSGCARNVASDETIHFKDLRLFIDAGKYLEQALTDHYGGYK